MSEATARTGEPDEYDGWHMPCRLGHTRVYTHREYQSNAAQTIASVPDTVAHLLCTSSPNSASRAICGAEPSDIYWYGTGDQDELDTAKVLALCPDCHKAVKPAST